MPCWKTTSPATRRALPHCGRTSPQASRTAPRLPPRWNATAPWPGPWQRQGEKLAAELAELDAELLRLTSENNASGARRDILRAEAADLTAKRTEAQVAKAAAEAAAQAAQEQLPTLAENTEALEAQRDEAKQDLADTIEYRKMLAENEKQLANVKAGVELKLKGRRAALNEADAAEQKLGRELDAARQRLGVLKELEKNMDGYQNSVKTVMRAASARRLRGIIGPVSSILSVEPGREVAIETALGGALQNIVAENEAAAKAGIIKPGSPVVSYGGVPEADAVIARVAKEQNAPLMVVDLSRLQVEGGDLDAVTFDFDGLDGVRLPLIGSYQPKNAALAITALRVLRGRGWNIPDSAIRTGLEQVSWPGRFELLRHSPAFLLDGSHNAHGMRATVQSLRDRFPGQKFVFLLSIMADKDVDEMLALLLPLAKRFVTVAAHTPRAMPAETLAEHIRARGGKAEAAADIPAGVARAVELGGDGPVCALGTLYFSGDVRQAFARLTAE